MKQKKPRSIPSLVSRRSRWLGSISVLCGLVFGTNACQPDIEIPFYPSQSEILEGKINLSYEVETLTIPDLEGVGKKSAQGQIMAMPFSTRSKIQVSVREDGSTNWRIERMKPKNDLSAQHLTPPGDESETHLTVVDETGMASFYDDNGVLLYSNSIPAPSFKSVMTDLKEDPNAVFSIIGVQSIDKVSRRIEKERASGAIVRELGNGMVSVRSANSGNSKGTNS